MAAACHNPKLARHEIEEGARRLDLVFRVDWDGDDLRDSHEKPLTFCSFECLSEWAFERAQQHDGHVLREGR